MNEHGDEPVRGLPAHLPEGEHILWQGAPEWRTLARTCLHVHWVAGYFAVLVLWRVVSGMAEGEALASTLPMASMLAAAGVVAVALLALYAWLCARTTVYTLTNRRFVLRHGVALSKIFNVPYRVIASAGLKVDAQGAGDIPLELTPENKIAYPHLWPHARPWRIASPQPMMRAVPDAASVAGVLSQALQGAAKAADRPFVAEAPQAAARPRAAEPTPGSVAA